MKINPINHSPILLTQNNNCISDFLAAIKQLVAKIFSVFQCYKQPKPISIQPTPPALQPILPLAVPIQILPQHPVAAVRAVPLAQPFVPMNIAPVAVPMAILPQLPVAAVRAVPLAQPYVPMNIAPVAVPMAILPQLPVAAVRAVPLAQPFVPMNIAPVAVPILPQRPAAAVRAAPPAITWEQKLNHRYPVNLSDMRRVTTVSDDRIQDEPYQIGVSQQLQDMENIPQIGRYMQGDYPIAGTQFVIRLPMDRLQAFPEGIRQQLQNQNEPELYFIIYNDAYIRPLVPDLRRNVIYHTIAYPEVQRHVQRNNQNGWMVPIGNQNLEPDFLLPMGIFGAEGVGPDQGADDHHRMAFDQMTNQRVMLHNDPMQISPNAARFMIQNRAQASTFFSSCLLPNGRAVAFLGMIVPSHDAMDVIQQGALQRRSIAAMVDGFAELQNMRTITEASLQNIQNVFRP